MRSPGKIAKFGQNFNIMKRLTVIALTLLWAVIALRAENYP